jgi:hypothetical protein
MTFEIEFGALAKPIGEQIAAQGFTVPKETAERFEKIAHSIILLHLQDIIPDSTRDNALKKLMRKISIVIQQPICPDCEGTGQKIWKHREHPNHSCGGVSKCPTCNGTGRKGP